MWDNAIDALVKIAWVAKASSRYRDMISEIKRKGKKPNFFFLSRFVGKKVALLEHIGSKKDS